MVGIARLSVSGLPLLDPHQGVPSVGERGHRLTERRPPFLGEGGRISGQGRRPTHLTRVRKMLPKLWKLLAIAILLTGINGNACFAETQGPHNRGPSMALFPKRYKCLDLLELERVEVDPQRNIMRSTDVDLAVDYRAVAGWLQGFFTAWNLNPA